MLEGGRCGDVDLTADLDDRCVRDPGNSTLERPRKMCGRGESKRLRRFTWWYKRKNFRWGDAT